MRDKKGRFTKGHRASPATELKKGRHWREPKPYWDKDWLENEYLVLQKSASKIAEEQGCTENNILYFLKKHCIPTRSISEARAIKYWGVSGPDNGMYGRNGPDNPNWQGGASPERQAFYSSRKWAAIVKQVWKRDNATCQRCGLGNNRSKSPFHIHHIVSFAVKELRLDLDNLILLCQSCHRWVHSKANVEQALIE